MVIVAVAGSSITPSLAALNMNTLNCSGPSPTLSVRVCTVTHWGALSEGLKNTEPLPDMKSASAAKTSKNQYQCMDYFK